MIPTTVLARPLRGSASTTTTTITTTSLTVLSSSAAAAHRAIKILEEFIGLTVVPSEVARFRNVIPWTVVTTECGNRRTDNDKYRRVKIHWLAPDRPAGALASPHPPRHSLLAITQATSSTNKHRNDNDPNPSRILDPFRATLSPTRLWASHFLLRRPVQASHLLGSSPSLPVLKVILKHDSNSDGDAAIHQQDQFGSHLTPTTSSTTPTIGLKEVVIPYDDDLTPLDAVLPINVRSHLSSPVTGLYRLPNSQLCVRPLPSGWHDRQLPPPTLVFHHDPHHAPPLSSPLDRLAVATGDEEVGTVKLQKIGHSGGRAGAGATRFPGQFRLESPDLDGLDVRLCGSTTHSSMFAEAHESLLAGSIEKLQSTRVLTASRAFVNKATTTSTESDYDDNEEEERRRRRSDCWMEFRATVRSPMGFFRRHRPGEASRRTAKAPDLPYD